MLTVEPMASGSRKLLRDIMRPRKTVNSLPGVLAAGDGAGPVLYTPYGPGMYRADAAESPELLHRPDLLMKSGSTSSITGAGTAAGSWIAQGPNVPTAASLGAAGASDGPPMNALLRDVKNIIDSIFRLRSAIQAQSAAASPPTTPASSTLTTAVTPFADELPTLEIRERLGDVLTTLQAFINKYPALNSNPVLNLATDLVSKVKGFDYSAKDVTSRSVLYDAIEKVALAFSNSVVELIVANPDCFNKSSQHRWKDGSRENLLSNGSGGAGGTGTTYDHVGAATTTPDLLLHADVDARLTRMETGVEHALEIAKAWSKHVKDVIGYLEKRTALEAEFAKSVLKLAQLTLPSIKENSFQPLQPTFVTAINQDKDYGTMLAAASAVISVKQCIEPLARCRSDYDKQRKVIKEAWLKEVKRMSDCVANMKKAKLLYEQRCQDHERARESSKVSPTDALNSSTGMLTLKSAEKRKKTEDEAGQRAKEAETVYKSCVLEANNRRKELVKVKEDTLRQTRELIVQSEQTMKGAVSAYFQLQQAITTPLPEQFNTLYESCQSYVPGDQYAQYIRHLPLPGGSASAVRSSRDDPGNPSAHETFAFEPYVPENYHQQHQPQHRTTFRKSSSHSHEPGSSGMIDVASYISDDYKLKSAAGSGSAPPPADAPASESESHESSENKSHDSSPSASPRIAHRRQGSDSLNASNPADSQAATPTFKGNALSKAAGTHALRRLHAPSRCRACDSYVYLQGAECEKCDLACHNKCLETLTAICQPAGTMVGAMDSTRAHARRSDSNVPVLVSRCIDEIDERGLEMRGIYRVSGVKSKVEKLCQSFELSEGMIADDEELSKQHPSVISNVLKLYLRQLPEPLLTIHLYHDFVMVAKEHASGLCSDKAVVPRLKDIVQQLPPQNLATTRSLMHHLRRVSLMEDDNQMNACNLGIVFGPTLLRSNCDEGTASLMTLLDTPHQARAVELLIRLSEDIFGPDEKLAEQAAAAAVAKSGRDADSLSSGSSSSSTNFRSVDSNNLTDEILNALEDGGKEFGSAGSGSEPIAATTPAPRRPARISPTFSSPRHPREDGDQGSDSDVDECSAEAGGPRATAAAASTGSAAAGSIRQFGPSSRSKQCGAGGHGSSSSSASAAAAAERRTVARSASSPFPGCLPAARLAIPSVGGSGEDGDVGLSTTSTEVGGGSSGSTLRAGADGRLGPEAAASMASPRPGLLSVAAEPAATLCTAMTLSSSPSGERLHAAVHQLPLDSSHAASLKAFDAAIANGKALYGGGFDTVGAVGSYGLTLPPPRMRAPLVSDGSPQGAPPLAKSASATRVVFYSDVDSTLLPTSKTAEKMPLQRLSTEGGSIARQAPDFTDAGRPRNVFYAQSMKRKSDEPKFV